MKFEYKTETPTPTTQNWWELVDAETNLIVTVYIDDEPEETSESIPVYPDTFYITKVDADGEQSSVGDIDVQSVDLLMKLLPRLKKAWEEKAK